MGTYLKRALSKDQIRLFSPNYDWQTVFPTFDFNAALAMIDSDPVARGALTHFVDKCMEGDYSIIRKNDGSKDEGEKLRLSEKFNFRHEILRKIFLMGKMYNNVYLEIVKDTNGVTKSLNILDSTNISPITKPNGDPISYKSKTPNQVTGEYATWTKEEIIWIKFGDRTRGFAPVDLKSLWETLHVKQYIQRYVGWLWKTGQYRLLYDFKQATDKQIDDFLAYTRKHDSNFKAPFVVSGEMEVKMLRDMKETESLVELLKYYDSQILILLRIPPIDAGIPDASGRSNSDAQSNNLNTHITSIKKVVEDMINFDLFPKISKSQVLLRFSPNDRFQEKMVFETIQIMASAGFTPEAMEEYMDSKGVFFDKTTFKKPEEVDMKNPRDVDTDPYPNI